MADSPAPAEGPDDTDYLKGWTAQQGTAPGEPPKVPGTVVLEAELPDTALLEKGGIDTASYLGAIVVAKDPAHKAALLHEDPSAEDAYLPKHGDAPAADPAPEDSAPADDTAATGDPAQA